MDGSICLDLTDLSDSVIHQNLMYSGSGHRAGEPVTANCWQGASARMVEMVEGAFRARTWHCMMHGSRKHAYKRVFSLSDLRGFHTFMFMCCLRWRTLGENVMTLWPSSRRSAACAMSSFRGVLWAWCRNACADRTGKNRCQLGEQSALHRGWHLRQIFCQFLP